MDTDSSMPAGEITEAPVWMNADQANSWESRNDEVAALRREVRMRRDEWSDVLRERDGARDEVAALRADAVKRTSELHTWKETATTLRANRDKWRAEAETQRAIVASTQTYLDERITYWNGRDRHERPAGVIPALMDVWTRVEQLRAAQQETTEWCDPCGKHHAPPSHDAAEVHDR